MNNRTQLGLNPLPSPLSVEINRLCDEFQSEWAAGRRPPTEAYVERVEEGLRAPVLGVLLRVELDARRAAGEEVADQEILERFPGDRATVEAALRSTRWWTPGHGTPGESEHIGKYQVVRLLGSGGQARTLLALDPDLKRHVVLKLYHGAATPGQQDQVLGEGQALARVQSPYVARCLSAERDGDRVWLVIEFVPGRTLAALLNEQRPAVGEVVRLLRQIAEGLSAVHAAGLLHRDMKPSNVLIGDDRVPRLIDFGLAAPLASDALHGVSGTLAYMAPEQARGQGERIDARTDVFGLGAVLYELLTGRPPYVESDPAQLLDRARSARMTGPRALRPSIPGALERICLKALAAAPAQRYASAAEFQKALDRFAQRGRRVAAVPIAAGLVGVGLLSWALAAPRRPAPPPAPAPLAARTPELPPESPRPISPREDAPARAEALAGELIVQVWSPKGRGPKQGWRVGEPNTVPVVNGDRVHLQAHLNRPAYVYILWVASEGKVLPLHPWKEPRLGFASPLPEPMAEAMVQCPPQLDAGWPMSGASGLETALLLARDTPLPADLDLKAEIGRLPPARLHHPREVVWLDSSRDQPVVRRQDAGARDLGLDAEQPLDDPILSLMERLRPHFDLLRAVRFAHQGD